MKQAITHYRNIITLFKNKGAKVMKEIILSLVIVLIHLSPSFAIEDAPTVFSNKEAIELVQTHANFL